MKNIFKLFQELNQLKYSSINNTGIETASIPEIKYHKIGISEEGFPIFFIKCKDENKKTTLINLKIISISLNVKCELFNNGTFVEDGIYTQVILKSESWELQKYFIEIFSTIILGFEEIEVGENVKLEINKIINLFSKLSNEPENSIQGLWAELLLIDNSTNPTYLIESWHIKKTDKYDFNDGKDKIEVKSTEKIKREHFFSLEQLITTSNSKLLIASIKVYETGKGTTIFDLSNSIKNKLSDQNTIIKLETLIAESLGTNFEIAFEKFYDLDYGIEHLQLFKNTEIPTIPGNSIPKSLSQIKFLADLSEVQPLSTIDYESNLHNLLNISTKK